MKHEFTKHILEWGATVDRQMPWKNEKDPYLIWLSEIILQQTRVEQGLPYFLAFRKKYPNITLLAAAPQDDVLKLWQGLGYYSRARNLHTAAKYVADELGGKFPGTFEEIKKMKGVGDYTAAAIASFAYNHPHAVLDGNVYRVLSRYFGIHTAIDSTDGKKEFAKLADSLVPTDVPGKYNQAIMDFGALQCKPANPDCPICPLNDKCYAYKKGEVSLLPIKEKKLKRTKRYFNYLVITYKGKYYLTKRMQKDIWQNLYEFPKVESEKAVGIKAMERMVPHLWLKDGLQPVATYKQQLTHQEINAVFYRCEVVQKPENEDWIAVEREKVGNFAFPKIIDWFLKDNDLYFNFR